MPLRRRCLLPLLCCLPFGALAQSSGEPEPAPVQTPPAVPAGPASQRLPAAVREAMARTGVPESALHVVVQTVGQRTPWIAVQADTPVNPASLAKLVTTSAALDRLGPAFQWSTPVWIEGRVDAASGVLDGALHLQGRGDPTLVMERLWLLLRRVMALGVREIRGDIVLDSSLFAVGAPSPAAFDGEPQRPYNAQPSALLINHHALQYRLVPDAAAGVARIATEPPLAGATPQTSVPLVAGPCGDWRAALRLRLEAEPGQRFGGSYASACGELAWYVADPQPATFNARVVEGLWRQLGGTFTGQVRSGPPPARRPDLESLSPPLAEVVRDINKFSNNVMAEQLALTLALQASGGRPVGPGAARALLETWLAARLGLNALPEGEQLVNGSGLSRESRLSAATLAALLQTVWAGPQMPELLASLPVAGVDGTLRRTRAATAHLKTGTLRDTAGVAGVVLGADGRRHVLVAIVQHPQAQTARPVLEALVQQVAGNETAEPRPNARTARPAATRPPAIKNRPPLPPPRPAR
jgi:D-alanyl-D-alanine carboxypeptidase/D-alanyl-D-alanine-endopeptidase (penicillin-binding protein 4)